MDRGERSSEASEAPDWSGAGLEVVGLLDCERSQKKLPDHPVVTSSFLLLVVMASNLVAMASNLEAPSWSIELLNMKFVKHLACEVSKRSSLVKQQKNSSV